LATFQGVSMDHNINEYLAKVFRNETQDLQQGAGAPIKHSRDVVVEDQVARKFLVGKKYSLGLDEIV
jgi:hypothetical protein